MKILILIILILLIRWLIKTVNGFQKKEIRVQESLSGIEVALTKRYDKNAQYRQRLYGA